MIETKYCKRCDRVLSINQFSNDKKTKDGYAFYCKECCNETAKNYRDSPSGIYQLLKGRQTYLHKRNDSRSKPFNLTREEFIKWYQKQKLKCGYCDIPQDKWYLMAEKYGSNWFRLTVDCMDNDTGYTVDNLILACAKCNLIKQNILTHDEMYYIGQNFIKPKWQALTS